MAGPDAPLSVRRAAHAILSALRLPTSLYATTTIADANATSGARSILPWVPRPVRWVLLFILLVNCRSWPFMWHIRTFRPLIYLRLTYLRLILTRAPRAKRMQWLHGLSPVGKTPFELESVYKTWVGVDDWDYNMHMSNSSYAKHYDAARLKAALVCFPWFYRAGGITALGGTHYTFIREIPLGASFEIRVSIVSWDHKWVYVLGKYVTLPKKNSKSNSKSKSITTGNTETASAVRDALAAPSVPLESIGADTPLSSLSSADASNATTPLPSLPSSTADLSSLPHSSSHRDHKTHPHSTAPQHKYPTHDTDGAIIHALGISELCFKIGRITVPPPLALAFDGLCLDAGGKEWEVVKGMRGGVWPEVFGPNPTSNASNSNSATSGGSRKGKSRNTDGNLLRTFFASAHRAVPPEQRFWEHAFAVPEVEERRVRGLEVVGKVRGGMEALRGL